jgi:hypothetical protein
LVPLQLNSMLFVQKIVGDSWNTLRRAIFQRIFRGANLGVLTPAPCLLMGGTGQNEVLPVLSFSLEVCNRPGRRQAAIIQSSTGKTASSPVAPLVSGFGSGFAGLGEGA